MLRQSGSPGSSRQAAAQTGTLTDLGDERIEVVIFQRHVPEAMRSPEARAGFPSSLEKLEEHLAHLIAKEQT
ncbi:MAG: hypothetical protein ACRDZX_14750 [Acidimicrobiales bacterium]